MSRQYNVASFNSLKSVKESLSERYSSNQLMNVLDDILGYGLRVLIENTNFIDMMSMSCLTWYSGNSRRKISSLPKPKVMYYLALYPVLNQRQKIKILTRLRLERNIRFFLLETFLTKAEEYVKLEVEACKTKDLMKKSVLLERMHVLQSGTGVQGSMSAVYHQVKFWHQLAVKFRNQIMEKYMRHTVMRANAFYNSSPELKDLQDVIQNFQFALSKAIHKFDQRKGTLTSYVNFWLRNAQNPTGGLTHEYGIAYTIPASVKRGHASGTSTHPVNIFATIDDDASALEVPCDTLNPEQSIERDSEINRVRKLAKIADPVGCARLRLGIEEVLSPDEIKLLQSAA